MITKKAKKQSFTVSNISPGNHFEIERETNTGQTKDLFRNALVSIRSGIFHRIIYFQIARLAFQSNTNDNFAKQ